MQLTKLVLFCVLVLFAPTSAQNCSVQLDECWNEFDVVNESLYWLEQNFSACNCNLSIVCGIRSMTDFDLNLHIADVFIILIASFLGAIFPIVTKMLFSYRFERFVDIAITLGKCMGTGVVLACGYVHMLQPSNTALTSPCMPFIFNTDYNAFAFLYAMIAGLLMQLLDVVMSQFLMKYGVAKAEKRREKQKEISLESSINSDVSLEEDSMDAVEEEHLRNRRIIEAYTIEAGVTVHSVFIGFAVGVIGQPDLTTLTIALVFHQFFEGIAAGSRLVDAKLARWNEWLLILIFSISCPVGLAIGAGTVSSFNVYGETFLMVQGTFDGFCAGLLLYVGYSLLLVDFPRDLKRYAKGKYKYVFIFFMFVFLYLGAGLMAYIGRYL